MDLLDVNVWLALADGNHIHHTAARDYWKNQSAEEIAFCRVTALGFLRLSSHPKVLSRPLNMEQAWAAYQRYIDQPGVCWVEDSFALDDVFMHFCRQPKWSHHLWTDAYLAALAKYRSCRIVSFDSDFKCFTGLDFLQLIAD